MPDYSTPFTSGFSAGASAGHMRAMQMERMMELRAQEAQRAVQERLIAAQASMFTQHAKVYEQQALDEAQMKTDLLGANALYHEHLDKGKTPEEAQALTDAALQYKNPKAYDMLAIGRKNMREVQQFTPQVVQPTDITTGKPAIDEKTGEPIKAMTTGRGSAVQLDRPTGLFQQLNLVNSAKVKAMERGDQDAIKRWTAAEMKLIESNQLSIKTDDQGRIIEITQGPSANPEALTKANLSKVQESEANALETIDTASRLLPLINEETIGAKAFVKSWVNDRILAQRFPELASKERADATQLSATLRAKVVRDLRSDANIANSERSEILRSFPRMEDPIDSPARARMVIQQSQMMAAVKVLTAAKRMGTPVPEQAVKLLDDENLAQMAERGALTSQMASKLYQMKRQK